MLISAAGGAAHLGGVLAAHTTLPVIGVPVKGGALNGVDLMTDAMFEHQTRILREIVNALFPDAEESR